MTPFKFKFYLAYLIVFSSCHFFFGQEDITKLSLINYPRKRYLNYKTKHCFLHLNLSRFKSSYILKVKDLLLFRVA